MKFLQTSKKIVALTMAATMCLTNFSVSAAELTTETTSESTTEATTEVTTEGTTEATTEEVTTAETTTEDESSNLINGVDLSYLDEDEINELLFTDWAYGLTEEEVTKAFGMTMEEFVAFRKATKAAKWEEEIYQ
jgi:hypothetical protein